jgi:hypothetical protein
MSVCRCGDSNLMGNDRLITERWKQYFYETLNIHDDIGIREVVIYQGLEEHIEPQTQDEVWEIIRTLKSSKSPGANSISAELIKNVDNKLWEEIHALIEVIICPLHKKGDKLQCSRYRGISLLNVC